MALIWIGLSTLILVFVCLQGDWSLKKLSENEKAIGNAASWLKAFVDSGTHGAVAALSWIIFIQIQNQMNDNYLSLIKLMKEHWIEIFLAGFIGSVIDLDHFLEAQSFHLKDAIGLNYRPFLHNTTIPITFLAFTLILSFALGSEFIVKIGFILGLSMISHHIRDAWRRGIWLPPISDSIPISYRTYLIVTVILPYIFAVFYRIYVKKFVSNLSKSFTTSTTPYIISTSETIV